MSPFRRILAPVDFSSSSDRACRYASELVRKYGADLHLLHVVEDVPSVESEDAVFLQERETSCQQAVDEKLQAVPPPGWTEDVNIVRETCHGHPFVEISRYARENGIDLIVTGTHGRSGIAHMLIGSVAENVVRVAECPVLTVPGSKVHASVAAESPA